MMASRRGKLSGTARSVLCAGLVSLCLFQGTPGGFRFALIPGWGGPAHPLSASRVRTFVCTQRDRLARQAFSMDEPDNSRGPTVVICGAGIVGASAAFYLAERGLGSRCVVVEQDEIACAASGRAAGFLAKDWNDGSPLGPLSRLSYSLHEALAAKFGREQIGYREICTWIGDPHVGDPDGNQQSPAWLEGGAWPGSIQKVSSLGTTSQLHPKRLCEELMKAAAAGGVSFHRGTADGLRFEGERCTGVSVDGEIVPCTLSILAMGPWTEKAREWLPSGALPPVLGLKRSSVVFDVPLPAEGCLFHLGGEYSFYPRPDGTLYMSGVTEDPVIVEEEPGRVAANQDAAEEIKVLGKQLCAKLRDAEVLHVQSCYMPVAGIGLPLIGALPDCEGSVLVGTGHGPWGILNGPATGLVLAEMAADGFATSLNAQEMSAFDPTRFSKVSVRH